MQTRRPCYQVLLVLFQFYRSSIEKGVSGSPVYYCIQGIVASILESRYSITLYCILSPSHALCLQIGRMQYVCAIDLIVQPEQIVSRGVGLVGQGEKC